MAFLSAARHPCPRNFPDLFCVRKKGDKNMNNVFSICRKGDKLCGNIIWSEEQIAFITKHYQQNHSTGELSKLFGVSTEAIRTVLRKNKIKVYSLKELQKLKFPRNSNFFQQIDSKEKAYWLGFLYADGYISKTNEIRINLKRNDEEHLKKFLKAIEAINSNIHYSQKVTENKIYYQAYCNIRDDKLVEDLNNKGCTNNKSLILTFPSEEKVPKEFISHFVRGYFDGDGSIHFVLSGHAKTPNYRISFAGTKDFLIALRKILKVEHLSLENRGNYYVLAIYGNRQIEPILKWIYEDATPEIWLDRKRQIYENYLLQRMGSEPINIGCE